MKTKITVVGSLNMDMVITSAKMPEIGQTILGSGFEAVPGGKGSNQAVAVGRLGGDVALIGCVGNDLYGKNLIDALARDGINISNIKVIDGCSTGSAMIIINNGDNCIIVDPGANMELKEEMVEVLEDEIRKSSLLMVQLEIPLKTVEKAIEIARRNNVKVLLNPAPALKLNDGLLSKVDIFTPNKSECEMITGININSIEDAKLAVSWLNKKGISQAVVTLGGNGVVYNNGETITHKPGQKVKVADTTAAGDSFNGALALAISQGRDIDYAIDFANIVGALSVTKKGAQTSIPYLHEVLAYIDMYGLGGHRDSI